MTATRSPGRSTPANLQERVGQLYDHLYANASVRTPAGIFTEVGKILHAAMFVEQAQRRVPAFEFDRKQIEELRCGGPISTRVAGECRRAFDAMNLAWNLYDENANLGLGDFDLGYVCACLGGQVMTDARRDVFGDTLEIFRSQWAKRTGGMFFTDSQVTSLAMTLLNFDPRRGDDLIDICAGTGGFLLAGLNHTRALLEQGDRPVDIEAALKRVAMQSLRGQEVDPDVAAIANATLGSRLGHVEPRLVATGDSLAAGAFGDNHPKGLRVGTHLCAASNPPFGTRATVKAPNVLARFELAHAGTQCSARAVIRNGRLAPRPPDVLLLEQNVRMLRQGQGRLAIVLPYQLLSGPRTIFVRRWLLRHCLLRAVIDLPAETFQPHTGTKTSLLVVKRRERPIDNGVAVDDPAIFMARPRWIGHDRRGNPIYARDENGAPADRILTDFDAVREAFEHHRAGGDPRVMHDGCFTVPAEAVRHDGLMRFNALFHRPSRNRTRAAGSSRAWTARQLSTVVERVFCPGRFKRAYVDPMPDAVPFLGGANISQHVPTISKWLHPGDPKLPGLRVRTGWILITRSGTTGIVATVPAAWDGYAMSEHIIRVIPDAKKLSPAYLYTYLKTPQAQEQLARGVFGSVIDEITPEHVGQLEIRIPGSQSLLTQIVERIERAEDARQTSMELLTRTVADLARELVR